MIDYSALDTPCWLFDPDRAVANYRQFKHLFEDADIAYAFKTNPHPALSVALHQAGAHFCVVSRRHLEQLLALRVCPTKFVYSHVIKSLDEIQFALKSGVRRFACDSRQEIDKLAFFNNSTVTKTPIEVFLRLDVDNSGSVIPLSGKFGVKPDTAMQLMYYAEQQRLIPVGFTFHIGSQCLKLNTWENAIKTVAEIWNPARETFGIDFLNIGGGFVAPYENDPQPSLTDTAKTVHAAIRRFLPRVRHLVLEPGRAIAATAGSLLTSVTGIAERPDGQTWLFLDAGVFNGLFETIDGIQYPVDVLPAPCGSLQARFQIHQGKNSASKNGINNRQYVYMLAGPTCDAMDKLFTITTPRPVSIGDRLLFRNAGAYGYSLESAFNGYTAPAVEVLGQRADAEFVEQPLLSSRT